VDVWLAKFTGNNKATVRLRKAQKAIHDCIARLREIFDIFDPDGDGSITEEELVCVLNTLSSREQVLYTEEEIHELLLACDKDSNGLVDFSEFAQVITEGLGSRTQSTIANVVESMKRWFEVFDADNNGRVSDKELIQTMCALGLKPTPAQIRSLVSSKPNEPDGLSFASFTRVVLGDEATPEKELLLQQNWEYRDSFSLFSTNGTHATWDSWIKGVAALQHPALDPRQLAELISGEPLLLIDDPKQVVVRLAQFSHAMSPGHAQALGGGVPEMRTQICHCRDCFLMFDIDHNGFISRDEILAALSSMGEVCANTIASTRSARQQQIAEMVMHATSHLGSADELCFVDFVDLWLNPNPPGGKQTVHVRDAVVAQVHLFRQGFECMDCDQTGSFSVIEATKIMKRIDIPNAEAAGQKLIENCDQNANGAVTFYELTRTAMLHLGSVRLGESVKSHSLGDWKTRALESVETVDVVGMEEAATICRLASKNRTRSDVIRMIDFTVQQSTHVFRNMDPVVRQELMTYIQEVELAPGTALWEPKENPDAAYILLEGEVVVSASPQQGIRYSLWPQFAPIMANFITDLAVASVMATALSKCCRDVSDICSTLNQQLLLLRESVERTSEVTIRTVPHDLQSIHTVPAAVAVWHELDLLAMQLHRVVEDTYTRHLMLLICKAGLKAPLTVMNPLCETLRLCDHLRQVLAPGIQALDVFFRNPQCETKKRVDIGTAMERDVPVQSVVLRPSCFFGETMLQSTTPGATIQQHASYGCVGSVTTKMLIIRKDAFKRSLVIEIVAFFAQAPMTKTLDKGDLQQLALAVSPLEIPFGEALFQAGQPATHMAIVKSGCLKINYTEREFGNRRRRPRSANFRHTNAKSSRTVEVATVDVSELVGLHESSALGPFGSSQAVGACCIHEADVISCSENCVVYMIPRQRFFTVISEVRQSYSFDPQPLRLSESRSDLRNRRAAQITRLQNSNRSQRLVGGVKPEKGTSDKLKHRRELLAEMRIPARSTSVGVRPSSAKPHRHYQSRSFGAEMKQIIKESGLNRPRSALVRK